MTTINIIGTVINYNRIVIEQHNHINYKNEHATLTGEMSQINAPYLVRHNIEQCQTTIKKAYQYSQVAMHMCIFPQYFADT